VFHCLIVSVASSGPAPTGPSCAEGSRAGCRTPGEVSSEQSRVPESPPLTCWPRCWGCSPEYDWPSRLQAHIVDLCPAFRPSVPQVLLRRAALNPFIPQSVLILRTAPTQVQDLALGLVEPHEVHMGPPLRLVQVSLDDIPSFWCVNCTTQLGVICKLAEGALDHAVYVLDENVKQQFLFSKFRLTDSMIRLGTFISFNFSTQNSQQRSFAKIMFYWTTRHSDLLSHHGI